jgi:DNA-binding transcriptional LysR family regulator
MAPPADHRRTQIARLIRIAAAITAAGPLISELIHPWILRYPAIGIVVGTVEVAWRALYPAQPATAVLIRVPAPTSPPDDEYGGPP